jgi:hypothetical protein
MTGGLSITLLRPLLLTANNPTSIFKLKGPRKAVTVMRSKLLMTILTVLGLLSFSMGGYAGVSINIGISPPPLAIRGSPELAVIPGTNIYYCPDVAADIFFYHGFWYRPYEGGYYRAVSYEGPWAYIDSRNVPGVFIRLPPRFRSMEVYRRVPYNELHRNWRTWERSNYWDRVARERHEFEGQRERHEGIAPRFDERGHAFDRGTYDRGRDRHDFSRARERVR